MKLWIRRVFLFGLYCFADINAFEKGFWTTLTVDSCHPLGISSLADGLTSYGTSAYQEGCAADRRYYPEGTRLFVATSLSGKKPKGKWFTVDDTNPKTVRKKDKIMLRFMTEATADNWKKGVYKVYVILP